MPAEHSPAPTPSRAVYGFVYYLLGAAVFAAYLAWALLPDWILVDWLGVTFLPQKYWAVAAPIYAAVVFVSLVMVGYPSLGMCVTPTLVDIRNVTDEHAAYYVEERGVGEVVGPGGDEKEKKKPPQVGDVSLKQQVRDLYHS